MDVKLKLDAEWEPIPQDVVIGYQSQTDPKATIAFKAELQLDDGTKIYASYDKCYKAGIEYVF